MFFSGFCQQRGRNVLLGPDNFRDLRHGERGFELRYRCHCGADGVVYPDLEATGSCLPDLDASRVGEPA